jgi:hypothetical protein
VPTLLADDAEFTALIDVLARYPGTSLQVVLDTFMRMTAPASTARLARLCAGKPVRVQWGGVPTLMFQKYIPGPMIDLHEQFKKYGLDPSWKRNVTFSVCTLLSGGFRVVWLIKLEASGK